MSKKHCAVVLAALEKEPCTIACLMALCSTSQRTIYRTFANIRAEGTSIARKGEYTNIVYFVEKS